MSVDGGVVVVLLPSTSHLWIIHPMADLRRGIFKADAIEPGAWRALGINPLWFFILRPGSCNITVLCCDAKLLDSQIDIPCQRHQDPLKNFGGERGQKRNNIMTWTVKSGLVNKTFWQTTPYVTTNDLQYWWNICGICIIYTLGILAHLVRGWLGCTITETKRQVFRFHETILRLGDWIPRVYCRVPKGGVFKGGVTGEPTVRIPREDWGPP